MININIEEPLISQPLNFIGNWPYIVNLSNSIIGVPLLALPFCFKECGILLGFMLLFGSSYLGKFSCKILIKSAVLTHRRSYEFLAYSTLGFPGKILVEISIIGLLVGTCMAFYIIIGDIGPYFISRITTIENSKLLRICVIFMVGSCIILPLSLQPSFESISNLSTMSLTFYIIFMAYMIVTSFSNISTLKWFEDVVWWNWDGTFKCLPIFALSYACQSQLFIMYDSLINVTTKRVDTIIDESINLCTVIYSMVGLFGYLAYSRKNIEADILMTLEPGFASQLIKLGFMLSTILSFPLIIFPCRASIYILLFTKNGNVTRTHSGSVHIPQIHHQNITIFLVISTMIFAIIQPNVEFVLGITGATLGSLIIFVFPSIIFFMLPSKESQMFKFLTKVLFLIGIIVLILSTYVTLFNEDMKHSQHFTTLPINIETLHSEVLDEKPIKLVLNNNDLNHNIVKRMKIDTGNSNFKIESKNVSILKTSYSTLITNR